MKRLAIICVIFLLITMGIHFGIQSWKNSQEVENQKEQQETNNIAGNISEEKEEQAMVREDNTIVFPDVLLEKAIKEELGISHNISIEEASGVIKLYLEEKGIQNLAGIEYFSNLQTLILGKNKIKDLSCLKNLTNLKTLILERNAISNIDDLKNLKQLETLNIGYNQVRDLSPIQDLQQLDYPYINGNPIEDYTILSKKIDTMSKMSAKVLNISENDSYILQEKENKSEEYQKNQIAITEMKKWVEENITPEMSDLEKEYLIIHHIVERLEYIDDSDIAEENDIYKIYVEGKSVCFGYALIFQYLANFAGLESYRVETNLTEELNQGLENHIWNIVKIDDTFYQLDLTWMDSNNNYCYINISNETMERLHNNELPIFQLEMYPETLVDMPQDIQQPYQVYLQMQD